MTSETWLAQQTDGDDAAALAACSTCASVHEVQIRTIRLAMSRLSDMASEEENL
jgi:hypothetical protein